MQMITTSNSMTATRGFTLLELMIAVGIAAILATMAVPAFNSMLASTRANTAFTRISADLNFARSEAIKRNRRVLICRSTDGKVCAAATAWEAGWLLCYDADNSGAGNGVCDTATTELPNPVRISNAIKSVTLEGPGASFWFTPGGSIASASGGAMTFSINAGKHKLGVQPSGSIGRL
jgi:prepilin-type N-terminal cleavage/methylation domain-containing protein